MSLSNAFASPRRVRAAVFSMHQFCPAIRSMFRDDEIDDPAIEAMTVYLYMHHARGIFGRFRRPHVVCDPVDGKPPARSRVRQKVQVPAMTHPP